MTMEGGALSVQRGDLVAGRYRAGEPLGPAAWRAHDETGGGEVVLVAIAAAATADSGTDAQDDSSDIGDGGTTAAPNDVLDAGRWRDRRGVLPVTGIATGDAGAWLVTEPIAARTLSDAVSQWGALPAEQVLLIAAGATTALAADGPRISAAADHILLTDDGQVLLLPVETEADDLPALGAAVHLAAEGHTPAEAGSGPLRQPTLAALISTLLEQDADRATTLDRTFAELSRLGAPLDTPHGADTLSEAQAASAAAEAADEHDPHATHVSEAAVDTNDVTQPLASGGVPAQPMSATELLAETGENETESETESETETETKPGADPDKTQAFESTDVPTQPMSATGLLAETSENGAEEDDPESVRTVSTGSRKADTVPAAEDPGSQDSGPDNEATRQVAALNAESGPDTEATRQVPAIAADETPGNEATRQVPAISSAASADNEATQLVPAPSLSDSASDPTRPVPIVAAAGEIDSGTHEIPSPDDSATRALPIAAAAMAPIEPQPAQQSNPFVAPTQAAVPVPPTQAADVIPPQPQPAMQQHPAAPPTQAAAVVPPPGAPNPWLQQPQPQPQPPQGSWQQGVPGPQNAGVPGGPGAPGPWGPGPNQPPFPPNQPPYYPQQGPPPNKGNGSKTAAIIVGAVAAVAAVVSLVVLTTRSNGSGSDTLRHHRALLRRAVRDVAKLGARDQLPDRAGLQLQRLRARPTAPATPRAATAPTRAPPTPRRT